MKSIELYERSGGCCGPSASGSLVSFLQRKFKNEADIKVHDVGKPDAKLVVPPALVMAMAEQGEACLPAIVVDGRVVSTGRLPNFMEAVTLISGNSASAA